jgi:hypothetical protein
MERYGELQEANTTGTAGTSRVQSQPTARNMGESNDTTTKCFERNRH